MPYEPVTENEAIHELQVSWPNGDGSEIDWAESSYLTFNALGMGAEAEAAIAFAASLWDDLIALDLVETDFLSDISFEFAELPPDTLGSTFPTVFAQFGTILDVSIKISDQFQPSGQFSLGGKGFETLIHEFGHALGLSHPSNYGGVVTGPSHPWDTDQFTVMSYITAFPEGLFPQTPMLHDIAAIQQKYGADYSTRSDNTCYGFNCNIISTIYDLTLNLTPIFCVWDGAGDDTFDFSGYTSHQYISLIPGSFSDVGAFINNVSIAYNCWIENAVGGSGSDTIIGSEIDNVLRGGDGNDSLHGGGGVDSLYGGADVDVLYGGGGSDFLAGEGGDDELIGGDGSDTYSVGTGQGYDIIFDNSSSAGDVLALYTGSYAALDLRWFTAVGDDLLIRIPQSGGTYALHVLIEEMGSGLGQIEFLEFRPGEGSTPFATLNFVQDIWNKVSLPGPALFSDAFNRTDGAPGNGWVQLADNGGGALVIEDGRLSTNGSHAMMGAYRPFELDGPITIAATLTHCSGWGGIPHRYVTQILVGNDGTSTSGFGLQFYRGDAYYQNSAVILIHDGVNLATVDCTFQFLDSIDVQFTILPNLSISGVVTDGVNSFSFHFDPVEIELAGSNFAVIAADSASGISSTIDNLVISEGTANVTLSGTDAGEVLAGKYGDDTVSGGGGDDTLLGGAGADILIGGAGIDTTTGGSGDDWHYVDNAADTVVETAGGGLADRVLASVSYVLAAGVDIEILTTQTFTGASAIDLTGNELNQRIEGNAAANVLSGLGGNDSIAGYDGNDALHGGDGNDVLEGGLGADTTYGGAGNDHHYVNDALDVVVELAGEGNDRILASVSYTVGAGVAVELITTTGGTAAINLTGNELAQTLVGNDGANVLSGGGGDDSMRGNGGIDTTIGGMGDDDHWIDNAGDIVVEGAGEGDNDQVLCLVSYTLGAGVQVELLTTTNYQATLAIDLTGNELNQRIEGNAAANTLSGMGGNDNIAGYNGNDTIYGGDGDDVLDGGAGTDTTSGGLGNDLHYVDSAADTVIELAGEGTADRVLASVSYTLAAGAEIELFTTTNSAGTDAINFTGNSFGQRIIGNAAANTLSGMDGNDELRGLDGNDILIGGAGNDLLLGGNGADVFLFNAGLFGADTVTDFADGTDHIQFSGIAGVDDFTDLAISANGSGFAVITLPDGSTITLNNVAAGLVDASDFVFGP